jgi:TolA-binding protein
MAEHAYKAKKRSRSSLLLKAAFFGIIGGLLIAAAFYFFPRWFGLGEDTEVEDTETVTDTTGTPDTETSAKPPTPDKPAADTEKVPDKPDEPDKPDQPVADVSTDKPPPVSPTKPDPKLKNAQELGLKLIKKKSYKKALKFTQGWVKKHPDDPTMRYLYGRALFYRRKVKGAADQLEKAVKLDPSMAEAYYELGGVYIKMGQTANACACLKTFMKLKPKDRRSKGVRGVLRKFKCSK